MKWIAEYSPSSDKRGTYPWHIVTLKEHIQENLRALIIKDQGFLDWRMIGGPFDSNEQAGIFLDELRERIDWEKNANY
jgi:hypothetical protein